MKEVGRGVWSRLTTRRGEHMGHTAAPHAESGLSYCLGPRESGEQHGWEADCSF